MVEDALKAMGRIDILANIAGVNVHKAAEEMTEKDWDFVLDVNLKALFFCCQAVGKVMLRQGSGRIINMSSSFGIVGFGGRTAYAASKAAVSNLTKTLALEWSAKGINVNAIAPGPVWTEARHDLFSNPEFYGNLIKKVPINRTAKPAEIVGPAIFLASEASSFVTGATHPGRRRVLRAVRNRATNPLRDEADATHTPPDREGMRCDFLRNR